MPTTERSEPDVACVDLFCGAGGLRVAPGSHYDLTTAEALAERLGGRRSGRGWMCRCPAHDDREPSLSIRDGADGRVLLHCFAGCSPRDVCAALGLELRDLFPPNPLRDGGSGPVRGPQASLRDLALLVRHDAVRVGVAAEALARGECLADEERDHLPAIFRRMSGIAESLA